VARGGTADSGSTLTGGVRAVSPGRHQAIWVVLERHVGVDGSMTINFLRGRGVARAAPNLPEGILITDDLPNALSCPVCGRPLDVMNGRCAGCGTQLVLGVQAKRAGVFTAFGIVVGMLLGATAMGIVTSAADPATIAAGAGQAAESPVATGQAGAHRPRVVATRPAATPMIPSAAKSALTQSVTINDRLAVTFAQLEAQLAERTFDSTEVARSLRALAADAQFGATLAPQLEKWPLADPLGTALGSFYESIRTTAREGLAASLANTAAYKIAAKRMVAAFAALPAIDALTGSLATQAGLTLPDRPLPTGQAVDPAASAPPR